MLQGLKEKVPFMDGRNKIAGIATYNSKVIIPNMLNYNQKQ